MLLITPFLKVKMIKILPTGIGRQSYQPALSNPGILIEWHSGWTSNLAFELVRCIGAPANNAEWSCLSVTPLASFCVNHAPSFTEFLFLSEILPCPMEFDSVTSCLVLLSESLDLALLAARAIFSCEILRIHLSSQPCVGWSLAPRAFSSAQGWLITCHRHSFYLTGPYSRLFV